MSHCLPIYAFYTLLFVEKELSTSEIAVLIALWSGFSIIFELPSGILADRWNRRNMLIIAALVEGLCFLTWSLSSSFIMFAIGFFFWAVGNAFVSGTEEGLIYDNLKSDGIENQFSLIYGRSRFYANIGNLVGIATSGLLVQFISIENIALLSAGICVVNSLIASRLRERNYYAANMSDRTIKVFGTFKEAISLFKKSKSSLIMVVFLILFSSLVSYLDEFDALIVNDLQVDKSWVSIFLTVRFMFISLGDLLSPIIDKQINSSKSIFILYSFGGVLLVLFSTLWNPYSVLIFGLAMMFMSISELLFIKSLQETIKDEGRATVMSFYGLGQNVVMVCFSLVYGMMARVIAIQLVYLFFSIYAILGTFIFSAVFSLVKRKVP